jgi:hypothetical protein
MSMVVFDPKKVQRADNAKSNPENSVMRVANLDDKMRQAMVESSPKDAALMCCLDALTNAAFDRMAVLSARPGDEKAPTLTVVLCKEARSKAISKTLTSTTLQVMLPADRDLSESFTAGRMRADGFMDHESQEAVVPFAEAIPMSDQLVSQLKADNILSSTSNAKHAKLYQGAVTLRRGTVFSVSIMASDVAVIATRSGNKPAPPGTTLKLRGVTFVLSGGRLMANADKCEIVDHSNAAATLVEALASNTYNFFNHDIMASVGPLPHGLRSGFALPVTFADETRTVLDRNPNPDQNNFSVPAGSPVPFYSLYGTVLHVVPVQEQLARARKSKCAVVTITCPPITDIAKESEWIYKKKDKPNQYAHGYMTIFSSAALTGHAETAITYTSLTARLMPETLAKISMLPEGTLMLKYARYFVSGFIGHVVVQNDGEPHGEMLHGCPLIVSHGYANQVVPYASDIVAAIGFRVPGELALRYMVADLLSKYSAFGMVDAEDEEAAAAGKQIFDESEAMSAESALKAEVEAMWTNSNAKTDTKRNVIPLDIFPDVAIANHALSSAIFEASAAGKRITNKDVEANPSFFPCKEKMLRDYDFYAVPDAFKPYAMRRAAGPDTEHAAHAEYFFRGGKIAEGAPRDFFAWAGKQKGVPDFMIYAVRSNSYKTDGNFFSSDSVGRLYELATEVTKDHAARAEDPEASLSAKHVREEQAEEAAAETATEMAKLVPVAPMESDIDTSDNSGKLKRLTPVDEDGAAPGGRRNRKRASDV